ncbi:hypothetical protein ACFP81_13980 [Deinococcus lacus]|uniref:Lipoprotein n=1 Tax=Deinococcus lacus TaxID=392561 RepID=A0ABW1YF46_9DEIO
MKRLFPTLPALLVFGPALLSGCQGPSSPAIDGPEVPGKLHLLETSADDIKLTPWTTPTTLTYSSSDQVLGTTPVAADGTFKFRLPMQLPSGEGENIFAEFLKPLPGLECTEVRPLTAISQLKSVSPLRMTVPGPANQPVDIANVMVPTETLGLSAGSYIFVKGAVPVQGERLCQTSENGLTVRFRFVVDLQLKEGWNTVVEHVTFDPVAGEQAVRLTTAP